MQYRQCGKSDLRLPILGMGCWAYGGGDYWGAQDQQDVDAVVHGAVDFGCTYFDTAEVYNNGASESSLGRALQGIPRDKVIIGTKISPAHVQPDVLPARCEASLKRLGTDYIDLYMVHWPITPHSIQHFTTSPIPCPSVEDAFATLLRLQEQGKIRYLGVSNFAPNKMEEALAAGAPIVANELPYNLLCRAVEEDIFPYCLKRGVGVIGYMALLQGLLADIYPTLDEVPVWQRRTRHFDARKCDQVRHGEPGAEAETNAALEAIRVIGRAQDLTMAQIALKWALANEAISCVLVGSRTVRELEENIRSAAEPLSPEVIGQLSEATRPLKEALGSSFDYYETGVNDRTR